MHIKIKTTTSREAKRRVSSAAAQKQATEIVRNSESIRN